MPDLASFREDAADRIAGISRADLQVLLRRAALLLRNAGSIAFDDEIEEVLRNLSDEFGKTRNDTVRLVVREWMERTPTYRCMIWTKMATSRGQLNERTAFPAPFAQDHIWRIEKRARLKLRVEVLLKIMFAQSRKILRDPHERGRSSVV